MTHETTIRSQGQKLQTIANKTGLHTERKWQDKTAGNTNGRDRVVQQGVKLLLEPIFEADFHENSYAYRPKKNAHQAIDKIDETLRGGRIEVIDADLNGYFDTSQSASKRMVRVLSLREQLMYILKNAELRERIHATIVVEKTQQKACTLQLLKQ